MTARIRQLLNAVGETFWLLPAALVVTGILLAVGLVELDRSGLVPQWLIESPFLYNGGGTGARTLLGAVASSTIGVAGTVFSITIASLSLAAGQMGPRLLRNFVKDRGNQFTLGAFLGTFSYALMVLRSVRTQEEGPFVPHAALTAGILLAFLCVGVLVFFVGHMAGRINVDTVIELVSRDVGNAIRRLTSTDAPAPVAVPSFTDAVAAVADPRQGYLQELDADQLADWAAAHDCTIQLLVRPGDYVFPGAAIALAEPARDGIDRAIRRATALGGQRVSRIDLEFAVRQLVEIAVRALSPGINDPHTAMSVLDRLGAALCAIVSRHLPLGQIERGGQVALVVPVVDYDGLVDAMFHLIRQNAAGSVAVLIRMLEVLTVIAGVERRPERLAVLRRHADLVLGDGERDVSTPADLDDLKGRHRRFTAMQTIGPISMAEREAT
ncbi:DUF2254 domain-containing protein [Sphingomonas nostoxanthinifaciens]|uniref:DUF2254 domain-containing protein n=1 Tax=Sphingomonas nostoxanthinifaciens TaxID=2872652 RepID=UPI001CC21F4E|nr:DUF2254 domain-containing protein [Sphingomonas nostoxanthinifaciens]UAK23852.1 DUF2254 domain-containing protein [Sphingomonas nostoxanthinifaciens]